MDIEKKKRLQRSGGAVGSATDFLQLSPEEASFIELKLALAGGNPRGAGTKRIDPN